MLRVNEVQFMAAENGRLQFLEGLRGTFCPFQPFGWDVGGYQGVQRACLLVVVVHVCREVVTEAQKRFHLFLRNRARYVQDRFPFFC